MDIELTIPHFSFTVETKITRRGDPSSNVHLTYISHNSKSQISICLSSIKFWSRIIESLTTNKEFEDHPWIKISDSTFNLYTTEPDNLISVKSSEFLPIAIDIRDQLISNGHQI